jgi:hypothetical protein
MRRQNTIPCILEDSGLLAAFTRPSHIDCYAPGVSFSCCLPESSMILGIHPASLKIRGCWPPSLNCRQPTPSMMLGLPCSLKWQGRALVEQVAAIVRNNYDNTAFAVKNKAQTASGAANKGQPVANSTVALSKVAPASTASFKSAP